MRWAIESGETPEMEERHLFHFVVKEGNEYIVYKLGSW